MMLEMPGNVALVDITSLVGEDTDGDGSGSADDDSKGDDAEGPADVVLVLSGASLSTTLGEGAG